MGHVGKAERAHSPAAEHAENISRHSSPRCVVVRRRVHEQAPPHHHRQGLKGSSHITVSCASRGSNALRSSREGACRRRRGPAEPATCANAAAAQQARHGARRRAPARMNLGAFGLFKHRPPAPRFWLPAFFLHWLFVLDVSVAQQLHTTKTNNQLSRKERQTYKRHCNDFDVCLPFYQMKSLKLFKAYSLRFT